MSVEPEPLPMLAHLPARRQVADVTLYSPAFADIFERALKGEYRSERASFQREKCETYVLWRRQTPA